MTENNKLQAETYTSQRFCFSVANRVAAAKVKPFGAALAIARQLREGTYKPAEEPLAALSKESP